MKVIAFDPGYDRLGIAIVEKEKGGKETHVYSETFSTSKTDAFSKRLLSIGNRAEELIVMYKPEACALEKLFFEHNQTTAMGVSEVRGALLYIASQHGLAIHEYTPLQIKSAITSNGRADKKAVTGMVEKLLALPEQKRLDDEYDALACALTFLAVYRD